MSNRRLLVFLSAVLGIAVSCKQLEVKNLPYSIGGVDEMVVVLNAVDSTDTLFQAIDQYLGAIYNNTPQPEYRFGVTYIDVATCSLSATSKHRAIFLSLFQNS
jgi:hypothetical protein